MRVRPTVRERVLHTSASCRVLHASESAPKFQRTGLTSSQTSS